MCLSGVLHLPYPHRMQHHIIAHIGGIHVECIQNTPSSQQVGIMDSLSSSLIILYLYCLITERSYLVFYRGSSKVFRIWELKNNNDS